MMLMVIAALVVLGLCLGSFANALVWRLYQQEELGRTDKDLSITKGRSQCPHCGHTLAATDLVPVASWLWLRGKCRYCGAKISFQYPLVELAAAMAFVASYIFWPETIQGVQLWLFCLWLPILVGFITLVIYDLRWMTLPNRIIYPLTALASIYALIVVAAADKPLHAVLNVVLGVAVGGGLFYVLFQLSAGRWIGGGDVKLGWLLGLLLGSPWRSLLAILIASLFGTVVSLPLLAANRLNRRSNIPFGPFLIIGAVIVHLFGQAMLAWYQRKFLPFGV